MRRSLLFFLMAALLVTSCAGRKGQLLPNLVWISEVTKLQQQCTTLFPQGRWQLVHAIAFRMADGTNGNALGVLVLNGQEIKCALMTVEGLTLFEARSSGEEDLEILRALPPFANPEFAAGLMRDVRALFQPPPGAVHYGTLADGSPVCRSTEGNRVTDILPQEDGCWRLRTYSEQTRTRTISAQSCRPVAATIMPHSLELQGAVPADYTLNLRLISAERFSAPL